MCDNFVALGPHTRGGGVILAKNSDREPNEAQALVRFPRTAPVEPELRVTFISIPQVAETNEIVLSKPFQMWGAEMGVNEFGLAIGNEAVFTVVPIPKKNTGLTGMDMLRLALERCRTADQAVGLITQLVEQYGQDACGGYQDRSFFYFNSFAIADPTRAFILETVDRHWAALEVKTFRSISNGLTIEGEYDQASSGLLDFARRAGKLRGDRPLNLKRDFSDFLFTRFSGSAERQGATTALGAACVGSLDASRAMEILRSHGLGVDESKFDASQATNGAVCMHAAGPIVRSQTTGSLVAELRPDGQSTYWFTGTSAPCLSVFKPVFVPGTHLRTGDFAEPGAKLDDSLWWRHEKFQRFVARDYARRAPHFRQRMRDLEADLVRRASAVLGASAADREALSRAGFAEADVLLGEFLEEIRGRTWPAQRLRSPFYSFFRSRVDGAVGLPGR